MEWQVSGESAQQYGFTYDGVDRLLKAKYLGVNADACFVDIPAGAYDEWGVSDKEYALRSCKCSN
jgi:hypothetical protein